MNIRLLTLSATASAILIAATPMIPASMSTDNGGIKSAIDAYSDGGGVVIINQAGDTKLDNSAMNSLVFKYGQTAEDSGTTLKNQVSVLSADTTAAEKAISVKLDLAKVVIDAPVNGTSCDDNNAQTENDVFTNSVCQGSYLFLSSCKNILNAGLSTGNGTYTINNGTDPSTAYQVYCDMTIDGGGWTLVLANSNINSSRVLLQSISLDSSNSGLVDAKWQELVAKGSNLMMKKDSFYAITNNIETIKLANCASLSPSLKTNNILWNESDGCSYSGSDYSALMGVNGTYSSDLSNKKIYMDFSSYPGSYQTGANLFIR